MIILFFNLEGTFWLFRPLNLITTDTLLARDSSTVLAKVGEDVPENQQEMQVKCRLAARVLIHLVQKFHTPAFTIAQSVFFFEYLEYFRPEWV